MYHEMICIKGYEKILIKGKIYPITGKDECPKCGNVSVSFGVKHGFVGINRTCVCGQHLKVTPEYWAYIDRFAEIESGVIEAVEELKESLELVEA